MTKEVPVIGHDDAAHGIEQHFKHGLWAEGTSDNLCDGLRLKFFKNRSVRIARSKRLYLGSLNVGILSLTACLSFRVSVEYEHWRAFHFSSN
jgi:hypothetical protein